jgi:hypothetical protein
MINIKFNKKLHLYFMNNMQFGQNLRFDFMSDINFKISILLVIQNRIWMVYVISNIINDKKIQSYPYVYIRIV